MLQSTIVRVLSMCNVVSSFGLSNRKEQEAEAKAKAEEKAAEAAEKSTTNSDREGSQTVVATIPKREPSLTPPPSTSEPSPPESSLKRTRSISVESDNEEELREALGAAGPSRSTVRALDFMTPTPKKPKIMSQPEYHETSGLPTPQTAYDTPTRPFPSSEPAPDEDLVQSFFGLLGAANVPLDDITKNQLHSTLLRHAKNIEGYKRDQKLFRFQAEARIAKLEADLKVKEIENENLIWQVESMSGARH
ncbi:hypothetical protein L13192_11632 [Pyrenophora tritici-repentis]|uniref:Uncharacterized protein n=1 Tax=Pyrenophora tritici-repentis TaxID=45151 RepID=A0A922NGI8_9PLEO|nr:hypothetical protein Ptr86124_005568 [Pyrenophora tritici-repentis]KAI1664448.1 hypothetical protein L13192_11632 [Pyrenophora tritici-repentis]KAI1678555.1 hypothetical protein KJE20_12163 [Pyrenophora tritici-repentis]